MLYILEITPFVQCAESYNLYRCVLTICPKGTHLCAYRHFQGVEILLQSCAPGDTMLYERYRAAAHGRCWQVYTRLRQDADTIIQRSIQAVLPDKAVRRALADFRPGLGRTLLVAVGKAAW